MAPDDAHMLAGMKRSVLEGKDICLHMHMERAALSKPKTDCRNRAGVLGQAALSGHFSESARSSQKSEAELFRRALGVWVAKRREVSAPDATAIQHSYCLYGEHGRRLACPILPRVEWFNLMRSGGVFRPDRVPRLPRTVAHGLSRAQCRESVFPPPTQTVDF
jgi:hypothetical protein